MPLNEIITETPGAGENRQTTEIRLATVAEVLEDGLRLQFDGSDEATSKVYKCNTSCIFAVGDRVKVTKQSGTYLVDYVIGAPGSGGSGNIPAGGSSGQVLAKRSSADYAIEWRTPHYVPSGGTSGQVLAKSSDNNYALSWSTPHYVPSGGTSGQVLAKSSGTDYAVSWVTPSVAQLKSGTYSVTLSSTLLQPSTTIALGNNSYRFGDLYAQGDIHLGEGSRTQISIGSSNASLGFFGHAVAARQTVASTATVAQLITALKAYGLIA